MAWNSKKKLRRRVNYSKTVTFPRENGETPKWVVHFLRERDTFRKNMEIVWDFMDKSYDSNNNGKPWKSSRNLRMKPTTLEIFDDFAF